MTDGQRIRLGAPVASDGMNIAGADTAAFNLDINIVVVERLGVKLQLVDFLPGVGTLDLEAGELFGVGHDGRAVIVRGWSETGWSTRNQAKTETGDDGDRPGHQQQLSIFIMERKGT